MLDINASQKKEIQLYVNQAGRRDSQIEASINSRLKICCFIVLAMYLFWFLYLFSTSYGLTDRFGLPLGRDFSHFWTASYIALHGSPASVYDFPRMIAIGETIFGLGTALPWLYPPTFLLIILPLALLPYFVGLGLWTLTGLAGYLWVVRRSAPHPLTYWLALAFPGTYQNLLFGQNGFMSAALLGGGLLLLGRFPFTAGVLLGLLSFKPHLMVLAVLALAAGRYWRALFSTVLVSAILLVASVLVLKPEVWLNFQKSTLESVRVLQTGLLPWRMVPLHLFNMPTVYCAMLEAGAGPGTARIVQGAVMLGVTVVVGYAWFRGAALAIRSSLLVLGILLFTPYAAVYDLALLALPLAWLSWDGYTRGLLPGELLLLVLGWLMPLLAPHLALVTHVQIAPLVLILLVIMVLRRWLQYPDMTKERAPR